MNHTVEKTIAILRLIADSEDSLSLSDITRELGLVKSTVFEITRTLEAGGFIEKYPNRRFHYQLGPEICRLGSAYLRKNNLVEIAKPYLASLTADEGECTAFLAVRRDADMVYLAKEENVSQVKLSAKSGDISPILSTGLGKAFLAAQSDESILSTLAEKDFRYSSIDTITDMPSLFSFLREAREKGYVADSSRDNSFAVSCRAVPVLNADGTPIAAISLVFMGKELSEARWERIEKKIVQCSLRISSFYGYNGKRLLMPQG